jgi:L-fuculose-phosphate aldolase
VQNLYSLKRDLVEAGRRVYERGFVASNDGNISARIDDKRVLITPTGVSKGFMKPEDMVVVDMDGNVLSNKGKPSSEVFMHLRIYKDRPDVNSVCHAHPPHATGYAVAGIPMDKCVLPEVIIVLGEIPLVDYGTPGTDEFYSPVLKYLDKHDAFLLANHGALTIGTDVFNAYYKMETLEHAAKIQFVSQQLGHFNVLNSDQVSKLMDIRKRAGLTTESTCKSCEEDGICEIHDTSSPAGIDKEALVKQVTETILKQLA